MKRACLGPALCCVAAWSGVALAWSPNTANVAEIQQKWASTGVKYGETDSLAACAMKDGSVRVFATAKKADRIDVFDASTGRFLRSVGSKGAGTGEFRYPNGIVCVDMPGGADETDNPRPAVLVVERDNARVQAFWADDFSPAGTFGTGELHKPYGCAISRRSGVTLYVTDIEVAPEQTVKRYRLSPKNGQIVAEYLGAFGDKEGEGRMIEVESIVVDDATGRVLICDEEHHPPSVLAYTADGQYTGHHFAGGKVKAEPEGIALLDFDGRPAVVVTDQRDEISIWYVFDHENYRHIATFTGAPNVANTDGICIYSKPFKGFPGGAMFAVNDDSDLRAYDLRDVVRAVKKQARRR